MFFILQGDSGGPLVVQRVDNSYYLAGITSFGGFCGNEKMPSVYTRVSEYIDWINQTMQE